MQFIDLAQQQARIKTGIERRIQDVLAHGKYIMGPEVAQLETELAAFSGSRFCISCANGTDALQLALMALGVGAGDAVFVPNFTFASTAEVVPLLGATPMLTDIEPDTFNMCTKSLERTIQLALETGLTPKVVIPVDLFGQPANYPAIEKISVAYDLKIIADSAQGYGAEIGGKRTGSFGDITTTSFFPAKPLGCYGDGGAIFTDDEGLDELLRSLRVHGKGSNKYDNVRIGLNSRLDTLQAAILLEKLRIYEVEIEARNVAASRYDDLIAGSNCEVPFVRNDFRSVWAQYTLIAPDEEMRTEKMSLLKEAGVPTMIYYPNPLNTLTAFSGFPSDPKGLSVSENMSKRVFSLPMHPYLDFSDNEFVETLNTCFHD